MPTLGTVELLVFFVLIAVAIVTVIVVSVRRSSARPTIVVASVGHAMSAPELERLLGDLVAQGKKVTAIKVLRDHTGLGLKDAKNLVDGIAQGRAIGGHPALARVSGPRPAPRGDLATRVRELKADGREEQAVHLVRGETGMGQDEAELFVRSL